VEICSGQGRAHPLASVLCARALVDLTVGLAHPRGELLLRAPRCLEPLLERLDRDPRGDLARLRASHSVGDDEQRRLHERAVLVLAALSPRVGLECGLRRSEHRYWM